ncbi:MAG: pseudouridine synthase [Eubacterium sp.]|nr:pseudouridine synthase [Eubacterium sp.]
MRINKYLASCGLCSRREADQMVADGRVTIDGEPAEAGSQVEEGMEVLADGKPVRAKQEKTYLLLYKPRGIVCTASRQEADNIIDFLHYPVRLTYAGRLDKDSEGLMLMTDDGDLIHAVMRAGDLHEKEYEVQVAQKIRRQDLVEMQGGVFLEEIGRQTRPCKTRYIGPHTFRITLTEGINREIRRMCKAYGYRVTKLVRIRIMNLKLGGLKPGESRLATDTEREELLRLAGRYPEK